MYETEVGADGQKERVIDHLELPKPGKLSPAKYDRHVRDLVAILAYMGQPVLLEREPLGVWVLPYWALLFVVTNSLKKVILGRRVLKPGAGVEAPIPEPSADGLPRWVQTGESFMAVIANRRSVMTLFSAPACPYSHQTRIVLAEKGITVEILNIDLDNKPEDLIDLNPYGTVPTLVDRELVLYESEIIMEYLDERFPHPPLMPVDPVSRAKSRLAMFRIERDWYSLLPELESKNEKTATKARKILRDSLTATSEVFAARPFFLSDEFSLVDCALAPLLWRLPYYKVDLPKQAKAVLDYAQRIFSRESFCAGLTDMEREMRD